MEAKVSLRRGDASKKYDVLTALGAYACAGDKHLQRRVLRFLTLVTARYNWQRGELCVGRRELASLWNVNERTVKRDVALLKSQGWLTIKRPAARGRVTVYSVDWDVVLADTKKSWSHVGSDYVARMMLTTGQGAPAQEPTRVVAFPQPPKGDTEWDLARGLLHHQDPALYASWLAQLERVTVSQGVLELSAPSLFHAQYVMTHAQSQMESAVLDADPNVHRVVVRSR